MCFDYQNNAQIPQKEMKQKEKKIKDWLKCLNNPYKKQAITNLDTNLKEVKVNSICEALAVGFSWEQSKEGLEYWEEVYERLENIEKYLQL